VIFLDEQAGRALCVAAGVTPHYWESAARAWAKTLPALLSDATDEIRRTRDTGGQGSFASAGVDAYLLAFVIDVRMGRVSL
jgi:hypothetical protein